MDTRRMTADQAREIMARVLARHNVAKHLGSHNERIGAAEIMRASAITRAHGGG